MVDERCFGAFESKTDDSGTRVSPPQPPAPGRRILQGSPTCDTRPGSLSFHRKGAEVRASGTRIFRKRADAKGVVVPCNFEFRARLFLGRRCGLSLTKTIKFRPVRPTQSVRSLSQNCQLNPKDVSANVLLQPPFRLPVGMRKWPKFSELRCRVTDISSPSYPRQFQRAGGSVIFRSQPFWVRFPVSGNSPAYLVMEN